MYMCVHICTYTYIEREHMLKKFLHKGTQSEKFIDHWSSPFILERRKLKLREKVGTFPKLYS